MTVINNESVLSIFPLIRSAIMANSTLSVNFNKDNILQFEPKHKGVDSDGFPYFWANIPSTEEDKVVFDNNFTETRLMVSVFLRMDWNEDRDNVRDYCNAFMRAIWDYENTFESSGYYDVMIELIDVNPNQLIQTKQVIESEFLITFRGQVNR